MRFDLKEPPPPTYNEIAKKEVLLQKLVTKLKISHQLDVTVFIHEISFGKFIVHRAIKLEFSKSPNRAYRISIQKLGETTGLP